MQGKNKEIKFRDKFLFEIKVRFISISGEEITMDNRVYSSHPNKLRTYLEKRVGMNVLSLEEIKSGIQKL